jgi:hypothetical protein
LARVGDHMHEVIVHVIRAQTLELLIEITVEGLFV